jgi:hypothetical protein
MVLYVKFAEIASRSNKAMKLTISPVHVKHFTNLYQHFSLQVEKGFR